MKNYFDYATVAERYAASRPYFHPQVIKRIRASLGLNQLLAQANLVSPSKLLPNRSLD